MEDILRRVRALLAKAEGSTNPHEQDAFFTKAQSLMSKYQISEAQLIAEGLKQNEPVNHKEIPFPQQVGRDDKASLLCTIASLFHGHAFHQKPRHQKYGLSGFEGSVTIVGTPQDIVLIEMLWTTLCLQLDSATFKYVQQRKGNGVHGRTLRSSFIMGWVIRVAELLREAHEVVEETTLSSSTAMVFVGKDQAVSTYIGANFNLRTDRKKRKSHTPSVNAGYREGNGVDVRMDNKISGERKAIN